MAPLDPVIQAYYERGEEDGRLSNLVHPSGPLEFARTQELIGRHLPEGSLRVLDIGGGPGAYSHWLASLGHQVHLIDPVPLHVEQARAKGISAEVGDARAVAQPADSADAVLMLGPLYHLQERADRMTAWSEAIRVTRPGGVVFAAAISRFAALLDLLIRLDRFGDAEVAAAVAEALETGNCGDSRSGLFTTSYFHRPAELREEAEEAGLGGVRVYNIEGPGFMVANFAERWGTPSGRQALLHAARLVEEDVDMLGCASHWLVVGHAE